MRPWEDMVTAEMHRRAASARTAREKRSAGPRPPRRRVRGDVRPDQRVLLVPQAAARDGRRPVRLSHGTADVQRRHLRHQPRGDRGLLPQPGRCSGARTTTRSGLAHASPGSARRVPRAPRAARRTSRVSWRRWPTTSTPRRRIDSSRTGTKRTAPACPCPGRASGSPRPTRYPWDGHVKITGDAGHARALPGPPARAHVGAGGGRCPSTCIGTLNDKPETVKILVNGQASGARAERGFIAVSRVWKGKVT